MVIYYGKQLLKPFIYIMCLFIITGFTAAYEAVNTEAAEPPPQENTESEWVSIGAYKLTAYCACVKCCQIWSAEHPKHIGTGYAQKTASGTTHKANRTIAVNPKVIPYGTEVYIEGYGYYIAEDTGGTARRKKVIDIYMGSHDETVQFGVREAEIYIRN